MSDIKLRKGLKGGTVASKKMVKKKDDTLTISRIKEKVRADQVILFSSVSLSISMVMLFEWFSNRFNLKYGSFSLLCIVIHLDKTCGHGASIGAINKLIATYDRYTYISRMMIWLEQRGLVERRLDGLYYVTRECYVEYLRCLAQLSKDA